MISICFVMFGMACHYYYYLKRKQIIIKVIMTFFVTNHNTWLSQIPVQPEVSNHRKFRITLTPDISCIYMYHVIVHAWFWVYYRMYLYELLVESLKSARGRRPSVLFLEMRSEARTDKSDNTRKSHALIVLLYVTTFYVCAYAPIWTYYRRIFESTQCIIDVHV